MPFASLHDPSGAVLRGVGDIGVGMKRVLFASANSIVSAQGIQTIFVDAKLNLTVKPHVTNEGTVMMEIKVTRNEPDFVNTGARGDPSILRKEAKTTMLINDGAVRLYERAGRPSDAASGGRGRPRTGSASRPGP